MFFTTAVNVWIRNVWFAYQFMRRVFYVWTVREFVALDLCSDDIELTEEFSFESKEVWLLCVVGWTYRLLLYPITSASISLWNIRSTVKHDQSSTQFYLIEFLTHCYSFLIVKLFHTPNFMRKFLQELNNLSSIENLSQIK